MHPDLGPHAGCGVVAQRSQLSVDVVHTKAVESGALVMLKLTDGRAAEELSGRWPSDRRRSSCPAVSNQGHGSRWLDRRVCFFSPAALRDRCKSSSSLDTLLEICRRSLFIYRPVPPAPHINPLPTTGFIIPACSFCSTPPLHSFRDVNKSDSGGRWNDRISLSAGSLVNLPPPHPTPPLSVPACSCCT